ncbi:hypothetical protein CPARA_1gp070 (nucleomorph) [Cryptomonas paramecium]|uniref:Kinetochore protein NDC80 n=1 Tax=Cryptomonas paramaecium TaxID=2898 RepID=F2HHD2_9CRYP|nr:hypothetical protein CPARA_1gp070 [Cryptomonas paramecium]AEA38728.1 hypothetical protein CPARA_1gp070 [Cryptomonas paramecium]|mmetsp:Transcript_39311/g.104181  ORF Transcript_39311/g.104181 Transcript_39311/m.104181 type:complete len:444 (+) Transcript_39311:5188-6519(+)
MFEKIKKNKSQEKHVFRVISDEIYITFCVYDVLFFFFQDYFSVNLYRDLFFNCKKKYIIVVLSFLVEKIIFYFKHINKVQKNAFFLIKFLGYPFLIHKIYFLLISRCCSWNVLTNFLEWLVNLVFYQVQLEKKMGFSFKLKFKKSIWQKTFTPYNRTLAISNYYKWKKTIWSQLIVDIYTKKTFKSEQTKKNLILEYKHFLYKHILILYKKIELNYFEKKFLFEKVFLSKFLELNIYSANLKLNLNKWSLMLRNIKNFHCEHITNKTNLKFYKTNMLIHANTEVYIEIFFYFLFFVFYFFQSHELNFRVFFSSEINTLKLNLIKLKTKISDFSIFFTKKFAFFFTKKYFHNLSLFARLFLVYQTSKIIFIKKKHQIFIKNKLKDKNEIALFVLYKKIFLNNKKIHSENFLPILKSVKNLYIYINIHECFYFNKQGNIRICKTT